MTFNFLLFNGFETLDIFGVIEVFGKLENSKLNYISFDGGIIKSAQDCEILTRKAELLDGEVLVIGGGIGTRELVGNERFLRNLRDLVSGAKFVICVCTGSALLAKCGVLDGLKATSNKKSFEWVRSQSDKVEWIKKARWVKDGKFYTSSGVSAGIDAALAFVADIYGEAKAEQIANHIEYERNANSNDDKFADLYR